MDINFYSKGQKESNPDRGKMLYAPAKRAAFKLRWYFILLLAFSPILILSWVLGRDWVQASAPGIVTTEPQLIVANGEGQVTKINIDVGDDLVESTRLMTIFSPSLEASITEHQHQLAKLDTDWSEFKRKKIGVIDEEIRIAKEGAAKQELVFDEYTKYKQQNMVSSADYASVVLIRTQAQINYQQALERRVEEINRLREIALAGPQALAKNELKRELAKMESRFAHLQPVSFSKGTIVDLFVKPGDWVFDGTPLLLFSDSESPHINAYVTPKYIDEVQQGNSAKVKFASGEVFEAIVDRGVELADKIPTQLADPFEGQKSMLKVKLILKTELPEKLKVEGLPVTVIFVNGEHTINNLWSNLRSWI